MKIKIKNFLVFGLVFGLVAMIAMTACTTNCTNSKESPLDSIALKDSLEAVKNRRHYIKFVVFYPQHNDTLEWYSKNKFHHSMNGGSSRVYENKLLSGNKREFKTTAPIKVLEQY